MVFALVIVALVAALAFLVGRYLYPVQKTSVLKALSAAQADAGRFSDELNAMRAHLASAQGDLQHTSDALSEERRTSAALDAHAKSLAMQIEDQGRDIEAAKAAQSKAESDARSAEETASRLREREIALMREVGTLVEQFYGMKSARDEALGTLRSVVGEFERLSEREQALTREAAAIAHLVASRNGPAAETEAASVQTEPRPLDGAVSANPGAGE